MNEQVIKLVNHIIENLPEDNSELVKKLRENPLKLQKYLTTLYSPKSTISSVTTEKVRACVTNPLEELFVDVENVWILRNFEKYILSGVGDRILVATDAEAKYVDLLKPVNDIEICKLLSDNYPFRGVDFFLSHIALLICAQKNGEEGPLNIYPHGNIFYVESVDKEIFVVLLRWCENANKWRCSAYEPGEKPWDAGVRVFVRDAV